MDSSHAVTVTFLFVDPGDSLLLWERHPVAMQAALPRFRAVLQQAVASHHGQVFNLANDTLQSAFPSAPDAVNAALQAQRILLAATWDLPLRPRLALLTGSAQRQGDEYFGPAPHRTLRQLSVAHGGQVLLCHITADLARNNLPDGVSLLDLGEHRLPDLAGPEHLFQLVAPGLPEDFLPLKSLNNLVTNLPVQPGPLVGRQSELQTLSKMLRSAQIRLVTLTGTGGTGKTRLALQTAADLLAAFPDGVFFVPLDQVADQALVASTIAQALSLDLSGKLPIEEEIKIHLSERRILLVLDNFEHLLPAAALVSDLLSACPQIKILVTSREALRLRSEQEFPVSPLPLPEHSQTYAPDQLAQFASVAFFIQRAQAARPDFAVDSANAPAVAEICAYLDGLPLAIELAAARVRMYTPQALLARLKAQPGLQMLSAGPRDLPARQQTLQKAMEWSYNLLNADEQALFRRLGVFAGGFTPEAVEAVCSPAGELPHDVYESLSSLVDKSLVRNSDKNGEQPRLSILYMLRQYALTLLERENELTTVHEKHAAYFLTLAEQAEPDDPLRLISPGGISPAVVARLSAEEENLRSALQWSLDSNNLEIAMRLVNALDQYWYMKSSFQETLYWGEAIIMKSAGQMSMRRAKALRNLASVMITVNPSRYEPKIEAYLAEAFDLYTKLDTPLGACVVLSFQAYYEWGRGERQKTAELLLRSVEGARKIGDQYLQIRDSNSLAWVLMQDDRLDEARHFAEEGERLAQEIGDTYEIAHSECNLGWIAYKQGTLEEALEHINKALLLFRIYVPKGLEIMDMLILLAGIAARLGNGKSGAAMCTVAQKIGENLAIQENPDLQFYNRFAANVREQIGKADWTTGSTAGQAQPIDTAIEWALENMTALQDELIHRKNTLATAGINPTKSTYPAGLTTREAEILRLLAQGLADIQIAEKLFISPRTVNAHLTSIYSKLGVNSRAAATRFAVENGIV